MRKLVHLSVLLVLFVACKNDPETKNKGPKAIRKKTKVVAPSNNQKFKLGETVTFKVEAKKDSVFIDSLVLYYGDQRFPGSSSEVSISSNLTGVGVPRLILSVFLQGGIKETLYPKIRVFPDAPASYTYQVRNAYPHDNKAYTQGLFFKDGDLYESTGKLGASSLRKVDLKSGEVMKSLDLESKYFGEGIASIKDKIYQITYKAQEAFVYNMEFEKINTYTYDTEEGWGLTNIGDTLVMSDGSEYLYFRSSEDFSEIKKIPIWDDKGKVENLNELEYIDGYIFANVYLSDKIVLIDPGSGAVVGNWDLSGLYTSRDINNPDYVLNGIAYESQNEKMFVTGKFWTSIYEIEMVETNSNL